LNIDYFLLLKTALELSISSRMDHLKSFYGRPFHVKWPWEKSK